jgi:hypothetical protein
MTEPRPSGTMRKTTRTRMTTKTKTLVMAVAAVVSGLNGMVAVVAA